MLLNGKVVQIGCDEDRISIVGIISYSLLLGHHESFRSSAQIFKVIVFEAILFAFQHGVIFEVIVEASRV